MKRCLAVILAAVILDGPVWARKPPMVFQGVVYLACYDGDTCTFDLPGVHPFFGKKISVRLNGVDTPEMKGKCPAEKALAVRARDFSRATLARAGRIDLVGPRRGKYFRIVARIMADGQDLAGLLIGAGLGRIYDGGTRRGWC